MSASGAVPALLPAHIGVSQTSYIPVQPGLCRYPGRPPEKLRRALEAINGTG